MKFSCVEFLVSEDGVVMEGDGMVKCGDKQNSVEGSFVLYHSVKLH